MVHPHRRRQCLSSQCRRRGVPDGLVVQSDGAPTHRRSTARVLLSRGQRPRCRAVAEETQLHRPGDLARLYPGHRRPSFAARLVHPPRRAASCLSSRQNHGWHADALWIHGQGVCRRQLCPFHPPAAESRLCRRLPRLQPTSAHISRRSGSGPMSWCLRRRN